VHWAHHAARDFPDGQLYVNLRGYDPDQPMPASDALAGFLRSLGVPGENIPPDETERASRYRSILAEKRTLVVLDNAATVEQVRPLLPGHPACAVVVTSRDSLAGLIARDGAKRLDLDLLPLADAIALLRDLIDARVDAEPDAAATLAEQCARLPLALRIAAELAATRPTSRLADLVAELGDQQQRLHLLSADNDPRTAVRAVFSWSYDQLDTGTARAFRLVGLQPGADFDLYAVAALTGSTLKHGRKELGTLVRAHLVQATAPGRYGMHDLLRAYANDLAARDRPEVNEAMTRLLDHYLHTASVAMDIVHPAERYLRPRISPPTTAMPPITGPAEARAWLDAERATLTAATLHAATQRWPRHAIGLAATLAHYLSISAHYSEAMTIHSHARTAAQRAGNHAAEATALRNLAAIHYQQSRYQVAADHLQQALALFELAGDRIGQARVLSNLGTTRHVQGRYQESIDLRRHALQIYREMGDKAGEMLVLNNLGAIDGRQGRYELAARHFQEALAIAVEIGSRDSECLGLIHLGTVSMNQGRYQQAISNLGQALALCRDAGYPQYEAEALARMGDVCLRQGGTREAADRLRQALAVCREIGNASGEADALNSLGEVFLATGHPQDARRQHGPALTLATQVGNKYQQARAHSGLGHVSDSADDLDQARLHLQEALTLFTELGVPEADEVRARLAALDSGQSCDAIKG
jgi:tetratricopeptide (TPR) repeat protein